MRQQVDESLAQPRLRGALLAVFSVVALLLASLGVYGVISCAAVERRQEIGIRVALGARDRPGAWDDRRPRSTLDSDRTRAGIGRGRRGRRA